MIYKRALPHPALANYIDCYWSIEGTRGDMQVERIFPDGSPGLVLNVGEKCITDNGLVTMHPGYAYLVGPMTSYKETIVSEIHHLFGVCFKAGAFSHFYNYLPLAETKEQTIELEKALSPDISKMKALSFTELNAFFLKRLNTPKHDLITIVNCIKGAGGQITVDTLAKKINTTPRQLERCFHKHIGITPKEFINIMRFQYAFADILSNKKHKDLLDIAIRHGYYDHAHLTNEVKRYTGLPPSGF